MEEDGKTKRNGIKRDTNKEPIIKHTCISAAYGSIGASVPDAKIIDRTPIEMSSRIATDAEKHHRLKVLPFWGL